MEFLRENVHSIMRRINPKIFAYESKETLEQVIYDAIQDGFSYEDQLGLSTISCFKDYRNQIVEKKLNAFSYVTQSLDTYCEKRQLFSQAPKKAYRSLKNHIIDQVQIDLRCKLLRWQIDAGHLYDSPRSSHIPVYSDDVSELIDTLSEHKSKYQVKFLKIITNYNKRQEKKEECSTSSDASEDGPL
jgi:leucyl aminopeptidase (aminopeptidase T)